MKSLSVFIKNIHNSIDFFFRKRINYSKGEYIYPAEEKVDIFKELTEDERSAAISVEKDLLEKYDFQNFKDNSSCDQYLENIMILELLDKYLSIQNKDDLKILDIGSKNFGYAQGLHHFFKKNSKNGKISLTGIEIDGFRRYRDFHTRQDYAEASIKNLEKTDYLVKDLMKHEEKYDHITWFNPFITPSPLLYWGLPLKYLKPEAMFIHAFNMLKPDGTIFLVNQYENEYKIQTDILKQLKYNFKLYGEFESVFYEFENKRLITIINKGEV